LLTTTAGSRPAARPHAGRTTGMCRLPCRAAHEARSCVAGFTACMARVHPCRITLCYPIRQVTLRSSELDFHEALYHLAILTEQLSIVYDLSPTTNQKLYWSMSGRD